MPIQPWVSVPDGDRAVAFYTEAFGASVVERLDGGDGSAEVAQLSVAGGEFWIQREPGARPGGARFLLMVDDPDAAYSRALAAGAVSVATVHEEFGFRTGRITDPFGWDWEFSRRLG